MLFVHWTLSTHINLRLFWNLFSLSSTTISPLHRGTQTSGSSFRGGALQDMPLYYFLLFWSELRAIIKHNHCASLQGVLAGPWFAANNSSLPSSYCNKNGMGQHTLWPWRKSTILVTHMLLTRDPTPEIKGMSTQWAFLMFTVTRTECAVLSYT